MWLFLEVGIHEQQRALNNHYASDKLSHLVCKHFNEWAYSGEYLRGLMGDLDKFYTKALKKHAKGKTLANQQELDTLKQERLDAFEAKVEQLALWEGIDARTSSYRSKYIHGVLTTSPVSMGGYLTYKFGRWLYERIAYGDKKEEEIPLSPFPIANPVVYHFHPVSFVQQMRRMAEDRAPWMKIAKDEIGTKAYKVGHNPRISEYFNASTNGKGWNDDINWCGAFISWCVKQAGFKPPKFSARAAMWQLWKQIDTPIYGAIAVRDNGPNDPVDITNLVAEKRTYGGAGHVTFVVGISEDGNYYFCLGGNQGGERKARHVKISKYHKSKIDWFVVPPNYSPSESEYDLKVMKDSDDTEILDDSNTRN